MDTEQSMKKFFKRILSVLGPVILGALGFSGCDRFTVLRCEYGTPSCSFKVDITVEDGSGKALQGIKVIPAPMDYGVLDEASHRWAMGTDTLVTDASGKAETVYRVISQPEKLKVYFVDDDGDRNGGSFAKDSSEFVPARTGDGDKHWYQGEWTAKGTKNLRKL